MKTIFLVAMFSMLCTGQDCVSHPPPFTAEDSRKWACEDVKPLIYSAAFLASSQAADAISSRGLYELNPVLGRGPFGTRQETIKGVAVAAVLLAEWSLRKHPALRRGFTWMNYVAGGATCGVAARNWSIR